MVTGSNRAMVLAISATTSRAPSRCSPQVSDRLGQAIQHRSCGTHSAGIEKPSANGLLMGVPVSSLVSPACRLLPGSSQGGASLPVCPAGASGQSVDRSTRCILFVGGGQPARKDAQADVGHRPSVLTSRMPTTGEPEGT